MQHNFDLIITADPANRTAEFRLLDAQGSHLAFNQTDFKTIAVSSQQGLFDLRNYLRSFVEEEKHDAAVAEVGVCIAEQMLGREIFLKLWESESQRALRIQLPGATEEDNHLAAALARVPWEIARAAPGEETLADRNLLVRIVHDMAAPATQPLEFSKDESLRILFVFAQARGARPLAARLERRELLRLFEQEVYPKRRVVADFLTHGVTREQLEAQIKENRGYHIVHWSGHGHLNLLELAKRGGAKDLLSGEELLDLFTGAGGFIPRLFFLSACHSGDILRVKDWNDFIAVAQGKEPATKQAPASDTKEIALEVQPGYTGTAHALLQRGVPSVVAMRFAVGDEYARELSVEFYRALLAYTRPMTVTEALTLARRALLDPRKHDSARYAACDHATPVLYGAEDPGIVLQQGRSPSLNATNRRLHRVTELTTAAHEHFVGRTWELAEMGSDFIGSGAGSEAKPVALITGLGGMGKTALTAEALTLWESRFDWVLLYQAKPNALGFEATLHDIHLKLYAERSRYYEHVQSRPADAIHRAAEADFTGPERLERLTQNLIRAMRDETTLLVLDNFETNLKPQPEPGSTDDDGERLWACQDPAWDRCLAMMSEELAGTSSRVMITCRRPLTALANKACHRVLLGPLPAGEAALYLREHRDLSKMFFSSNPAERALAMRLLNASRFHPLLMDRLARLATGGEALRPQLMQALDTLEQSHDYSKLPELFAKEPGDTRELAYLNDALTTSLDQLIENASPDARRLLWVIAVANDPVALGLLESVWSGESYEHEQLRQIKQMLDNLHLLPPELQEKLKAMPQELRDRIDALPNEVPAQPDSAPLLRYLVSVGLATEERSGPDDVYLELTCHEMVRERIRKWMRDHSEDLGDLTENTMRLAYAERLEAYFHDLLHKNMTAAIDAGSRALVYCVQAGDYDRMFNFASYLTTGSKDPRLLASLLPYLEAASESAPEGRSRWSCLGYLADALKNAGRPDASIPFYEQAAAQARAATENRDENVILVWSDLAWITGNCANALLLIGDLDGSRQWRLESAEAQKKAGKPSVDVIGSKLEAMRIDIRQGQAVQVLPQVEAMFAQVYTWWQQHHSGQKVSEAPDPVFLARVLISSLDIANEAHRAQQDWESALDCTDRILEVKRALSFPAEVTAMDRMNRAVELVQLRRFGEAKVELEDCLRVFKDDPTRSARTISSLADLFDKQGDVAQAIKQEHRALALREQLPDTNDRAISHNNLSNYLIRSGNPSALDEAHRHRLASLIYQLVSGLGQYLQISLRNYAIDFRRSHAAGTTLTVPRVDELLADSTFGILKDWLRQRGVDADNVQTVVDQFLEIARQMAMGQE